MVWTERTARNVSHEDVERAPQVRQVGEGDTSSSCASTRSAIVLDTSSVRSAIFPDPQKSSPSSAIANVSKAWERR